MPIETQYEKQRVDMMSKYTVAESGEENLPEVTTMPQTISVALHPLLKTRGPVLIRCAQPTPWMQGCTFLRYTFILSISTSSCVRQG